MVLILTTEKSPQNSHGQPSSKKRKTLSKCEVNQTHTHHPFLFRLAKDVLITRANLLPRAMASLSPKLYRRKRSPTKTSARGSEVRKVRRMWVKASPWKTFVSCHFRTPTTTPKTTHQLGATTRNCEGKSGCRFCIQQLTFLPWLRNTKQMREEVAESSTC